MATKTFRLEIVTPERTVWSDEIDSLVVPAWEGQLGVLPGHAPLLCVLKPGTIAVTKGGEDQIMATTGGFMEVTPAKTIILADAVEEVAQIDVDRARKALERARENTMKAAHDRSIDVDRAKKAADRAMARLRAAEHGPGPSTGKRQV